MLLQSEQNHSQRHSKAVSHGSVAISEFSAQYMFPYPNRNAVLTPPQYSPSAPYAPQHTDTQALRGGGEGRGVCGVEVMDMISTFRHIASGPRSLGGPW